MEEAKAYEKGKSASLKAGSASKELQKKKMKREIQQNAIRQSTKEAANSVGSVTKGFVDKAEDLVGRLSEAVLEALTKLIREHPIISIIVILILLIALLVCCLITSCSAVIGGAGDVVITTSFTAQDSAIVAVNQDYVGLEANLRAIYSYFKVPLPKEVRTHIAVAKAFTVYKP